MLLNRRCREEMSLAVLANNFPAYVDENLRIVNRRALPFRNAADDRDREISGHLPKFGHSSARPGGCMSLNNRHRITGIHRFRKHDKLGASLLSLRRKGANLGEVCVEVTESA
jgi:hypothetical protein